MAASELPFLIRPREVQAFDEYFNAYRKPDESFEPYLVVQWRRAKHARFSSSLPSWTKPPTIGTTMGEPLTGERVVRRLAAILAADVVGYSRLMGRDENGTPAFEDVGRLALRERY
jgi:hypothetical protein